MIRHPDSIVAWVESVTRAQGDRPALIHEDVAWTYRELWSRAEMVARYLLSTGLRPGDGEGLMGANEPAYVVNYHGIMRAGGPVVPVAGMLEGASARTLLEYVDGERVIGGR